ncbi:MAG: crossover junction endodeoxyribonuclease RuvC [Candidatus Dependentiae bacterium]
MIILGIDPGFSVTGYGILKKEGPTCYLIDYGYLQMSSRKHLSERVHIFYDFFTEKITTHKVTDIALETSFLGKNAQNFLKLGYLRGILYLLAHQHEAHLHEFSPREVKQSVTGYGGASKDQVERVIMQLFPKLQTQQKQDVTDALAVTLCGLWKKKSLSF